MEAPHIWTHSFKHYHSKRCSCPHSMLTMAAHDPSYLTLHALLHIFFLQAALSQGCTYSPGPSGFAMHLLAHHWVYLCFWRSVCKTEDLLITLSCPLLYSLRREVVISWVLFFPHYFFPHISFWLPLCLCVSLQHPPCCKYHLVWNSPILKELGSYVGSRRDVCHLVLSWRPKASLSSPGKITEAPKRRESMTLAVSDRQRRQLHAPCLS